MSRVLWSLGFLCLTVMIVGSSSDATTVCAATLPDGTAIVLANPALGEGRHRIIRTAQKKPRKKGTGKTAAETVSPKESAATKTENAEGQGGLKFSRDIAPIFVGNCVGCHNERAMTKNGKLDLTSFEKLMKGGKDGAIVVAGNPDESHLYLRLTGDETPRMPRGGGGDRRLSETAIERVGDWIKQGARLDAGIDPKAPLTSYAPTDEQLRAAELAKLPSDERNKLVETSGLERWKKGNARSKPEVTTGKNFMVFGILPKDRVSSTLKVVETQYAQLRSLLSQSSGEPPLKIGVYVFNDRPSFVEFVRSHESREITSLEQGTSNLTDAQPYVAALDPLGGGEAPPPPRRSTRSKKGQDDPTAGARSLAGVIVEALAAGEVKRDAKMAPSWLSLGLGSYFAARVDPRSQEIQRLRSIAHEQFEFGWNLRANEALRGEAKFEVIRAVGFATIEALGSLPQTRPYLPAFLRGMLREPDQLDDTLRNVFGTNREQFLEVTGQFVGTRYGRGR